ncbi:MAG: hypothetical protein HYR86_04010 [Candidatus Rokubacteria bacterium]|nr:hypothetical protein [Candidatus Rokubacteria bacterium]
MDLVEARTHIAEALVESIFRRARYHVEPFRVEQALRWGREDFSPNFRAARVGDDGVARELLVEVKYRPSIEQFLSVETQRADRSVFVLARRQWPALHFVLVSDRPAPDRSCFQVLPVARHAPGDAFRTIDLHEAKELEIFPANVEDHEALTRRIFSLLAGG